MKHWRAKKDFAHEGKVIWHVMPKPSLGCVLPRKFQNFTLPPSPKGKRKLTPAQVQAKGARAKKPRVSSKSFPPGWDKEKVVEAYKSPDTISKEDWLKNWNAQNEFKLTRDKVNRWAREIAQGRKSNAQ